MPNHFIKLWKRGLALLFGRSFAVQQSERLSGICRIHPLARNHNGNL